LKIILFLKCWKKNLGQFLKKYRTFYPKKSLSKIWVWDPGSEIRKKNLFRIPDPGVKKAPDPGSGTLFITIRYGTLQSKVNTYLRVPGPQRARSAIDPDFL
jgi:hypothetical protein